MNCDPKYLWKSIAYWFGVISHRRLISLGYVIFQALNMAEGVLIFYFKPVFSCSHIKNITYRGICYMTAFTTGMMTLPQIWKSPSHQEL